MTTTQQHQRYEAAYQSADSEYGIPDRKIVDQRSGVGQKILCLGCGAGNDIWFLCKDNEVVGMDYANSGLKVAIRHGIKVVTGDLNFNPVLPFKDSSFDVVICKDILEHLLDPLTVLKEVHRILRPGGYCVVSVPNHFYLPIRMKMLMGKGLMYNTDHAAENNEWDYMHIRFFTYKGFKAFLAGAGFEGKRWFWDFGHLAHYRQPEMWLEPQLWKSEQGMKLSARARFAVVWLRPLWKVFNFVLPRGLRSKIVALRPGLLCSGFYVHAMKLPSSGKIDNRA